MGLREESGLVSEEPLKARLSARVRAPATGWCVQRDIRRHTWRDSDRTRLVSRHDTAVWPHSRRTLPQMPPPLQSFPPARCSNGSRAKGTGAVHGERRPSCGPTTVARPLRRCGEINGGNRRPGLKARIISAAFRTQQRQRRAQPLLAARAGCADDDGHAMACSHAGAITTSSLGCW